MSLPLFSATRSQRQLPLRVLRHEANFPMRDPSAPALPADVAHPSGLLHTLLTMSLTAIAVLRPRYEAQTALIQDFDWVHLNPAGQRMLQQPACPSASLLTLFPTAKADGVFDKCCQALLTGEEQRNQTYYQADGLDGYFLLVAQRYEDLLVVNFTDTHEWPRTAAEDALRASQAREQAAHRELERVFEQAPMAIAVYRGPAYTIELANARCAGSGAAARRTSSARACSRPCPKLRAWATSSCSTG